MNIIELGRVLRATASFGLPALLAAMPLTATIAQDQKVPGGGDPIVELRQYKIVTGKRDVFIPFFENHFVESQEALGMRLVGQFRDENDPNRFTWIRQFANMSARQAALHDFYYGPVWKSNRSIANPMLDDNDNVLLLRPAKPGSGFAPSPTARPSGNEPSKPGLVVATIYYLWKDPSEGFSAFFEQKVSPALRDAGIDVIGSFVPETTPNNFPALPVRQAEKVFVWFSRFDDLASYRRADRRLGQDHAWLFATRQELSAFEERQPQVLLLNPTPRSRLR